MKFILVKDGLTVVGKDVYCGDDSANSDLIQQAQEKNLSLVYQEVDEKEFDSTAIVSPVSKEKTSWQTEKAKGTDQALSFLAKQLGLE